MNVAKAVELVQELLQSSAGLDFVPSSNLPVIIDGNASALAADLDKAKAKIAELGSTGTLTIRRHEKLREEVKKCHVEGVGAWKETSADNMDSPINIVKVAKANNVNMSVEVKFIQACFEDHFNVLQPPVNGKVELQVPLKKVMATVKELRESGRSISKSDY